MSTLKVNNLQVGQDSTATNNLTWFQPGTPDGTIRLGSGNAGSATSKFTFDKDGNLTCVGDITANSIIAPIEGTLDDWIVHAGDADTKIGFPSDNAVDIYAGGKQVRLTSDGHLGINRTTPIAPITARRLDAGGTGTSGVIAEFANSSGYGVWFGQLSASGAAWGATTGDFYWNTGGLSSQVERLRIDSSGRLLKSGQASLTSTSLNYPVQIAADAEAQNIVCFGRASDDIGEIAFFEADKSTRLGEIQYRQDHTNIRHRVGDIRFCTGGATEKLRIDSHGCVRVGNTATQSTSSNTKRIALGAKGSIWGWASGQLNGCVQLIDNYYWDGSNNKAIEADHCAYLSLRSGSLRFGATNSSQTAGANISGGIHERFRIDSTGRVLIGTIADETRVGDSKLQVYTSDNKHPAIRTDSSGSNGYTMFGDAYKSDESQVNIGISYSSAALILSRGCKVSDTADNAFLSSQDTYSTRPTALRMDHDGALSFWTTETNATTTTDSAVSLTEVFSIDRVGNIYQKITNRNMYFGASSQLKIGIVSSDPVIDALSGDLQVKNSGQTLFIGRSDHTQFFEEIKMNQGKGISFINAADTATGETVQGSVLDDYEEGTFVPTWYTESSLISVNYHTQKGFYQKVGRHVYFQVYIRINSKSGGSGNMAIYGLPYTPQDATTHPNVAYGGLTVAYTNSWVGDMAQRGLVSSAAGKCYVYLGTTGGTNVNAGAGNLGNGTQFRAFGSYITA